ncbi:uncharacterized protein B0H18DRAFT_1008339 [Fomitopsis serialis]|uniref:uncharacterized protein n=1 Tax=Fomitopsis serialis TaxID=139415 RepID=UPI002008E8C6|nr:uncharacterized protein B0H18DRAFT_1008339 [Neoantrodia serialis]KAH9925785.1 hypothetical protein B0H18DRAFT_1008339 [Neoantrodia serialis]
MSMVGLTVTGALGILSWSSVEGLLIANEISWVSALRVRALSRSRALACATLLLGIMPVISNLVLYAKTTFITIPSYPASQPARPTTASHIT